MSWTGDERDESGRLCDLLSVPCLYLSLSLSLSLSLFFLSHSSASSFSHCRSSYFSCFFPSNFLIILIFLSSYFSFHLNFLVLLIFFSS